MQTIQTISKASILQSASVMRMHNPVMFVNRKPVWHAQPLLSIILSLIFIQKIIVV